MHFPEFVLADPDTPPPDIGEEIAQILDGISRGLDLPRTAPAEQKEPSRHE